MALVRNTVLAVAVLAAPTAFLPPPLKTEPGPGVEATRERLFLTQMGVAGKRLFDAECAHCHGAEAAGGDHAPSLLNSSAVGSKSGRRQFHHAVSGGVRVHIIGNAALRPARALSFNEIELIARYVREVRNPEFYN